MKLLSQRGDLKHFTRRVSSLSPLFGFYLWVQTAPTLYLSKPMPGDEANGQSNRWLATRKS